MKRWIKNAPASLVRAYETREIGNGRVILERLLRDERMRLAWKQLFRYVSTDQQWLEVWMAIASARAVSNKEGRLHKRPSEERDDYLALARKIDGLAKKIENGPLEVYAYELFPQDVWAALGVGNMHAMGKPQRSQVAHRLLRSWPRASELLRGLERHALKFSDDAMNKPRAVRRSRKEVPARIFVWHLGKDVELMFGEAMLGTLAKIASVTFNRDDDFNKSFVQGVLRGGMS
jgi:hypothetical protein